MTVWTGSCITSCNKVTLLWFYTLMKKVGIYTVLISNTSKNYFDRIETFSFYLFYIICRYFLIVLYILFYQEKCFTQTFKKSKSEGISRMPTAYCLWLWTKLRVEYHCFNSFSRRRRKYFNYLSKNSIALQRFYHTLKTSLYKTPTFCYKEEYRISSWNFFLARYRSVYLACAATLRLTIVS